MLFNIAIIFIAALVGGMVAEALKQSPLIGYMLGGILAGPYVSGMISDIELVHGFADIGVILLMFTLGIEFSLARLASIKKFAIGGGVLQVAAVVILSVLLGRYLGLTAYESLFVGCTLSISSTMIVLRVLGDHGELNSLHGQLMIGILIVQDLVVIIMVSVLPDIKTFSAASIPNLLEGLLVAAAIITAVLYLAPKIIPLFMEKAAQGSNNDIFLILALSLGLGVAVLAQALGLSVSLGAFLAGLLISESDYAHEILGKILSLRDAFVILFFVSVGMMVNPLTLFQNLPLLLLALFLIIPVKFIIFYSISRIFKYNSRVSFYIAMGMMQTGEFSFVLDKIGLDQHLIGSQIYNVILASSLISILLTPLFFNLAPGIYSRLQHSSIGKWFLSDPDTDLAGYGDEVLSDHVIVCGYGRVGGQVGRALQQMQVPYLVIEYDHTAIEKLREEQIPYIYGDASSQPVLEHANPAQARLAVLALPDTLINQQVIHGLKKYNDQLPIISRAHNYWEKNKLFEMGATEVIQPEEEAGLQMVRHVILNLRVDNDRVLHYLENLYFKDYHEIMRHHQPSQSEDEILKIRSFTLPDCSLAGAAIRDSSIRETTGCSVVTIKRQGGEIIINPHSHEVIEAGDTLIMMGSMAQLEAFYKFIVNVNVNPGA
ncbi:MAG TPA: cation:proton antiporter [Syntrophomonas sp.]|nr:cation:proton antiporter [Syntrophomonas sp.]